MRQTPTPSLSAFLATTLALLAAAPNAPAQASFFEGFDGKTVSALEAEGWSFRNQSMSLGPLGWRPDDLVTAHEGTDYLVTDGYCMGNNPPNVGSNWALLPDVGQLAGEELTMYLAEGWSAVRSDVLELRYSPSGGTNTGSTPTDLGDFTVLLAEFPHDTIGWWSPHTIPIPGQGRIALRYSVPTGKAAVMYVDSLSVGSPPAGALPLPSPGETVHWSGALSPIQLPSGTTNVVAGGSVVVDPGVDVLLPAGATLRVEGSIEFGPGSSFWGGPGAELELWHGASLDLLGTAAEPILFQGDHSYTNPALAVNFGSTAALRHVQLECYAKVSSGAIAVVDSCSFTSTVQNAFQQAGFRIYNATLAVRHSFFQDAVIHEEGGYLLFDQSTLANSRLDLQRITSPQPLYLDGLVATGNTTAAPFLVRSFDVFFGPSNVIQGNLYPVRLESGGVASGSMLPLTGNLNDEVSGIARLGSRATWARTGLDYVMEWDPDLPKLSGTLTIEPGVTARFQRGQNTTSDVFWFQQFAHLVARGTPELPIVLTDDGSGWGGLFFGDDDAKRPRLEHAIVERADVGVTAKLCTVRLDGVTLRDNAVGAESNSAGTLQVRGSEVLDNGVGIETSPGAGGSILSAGRANLDGSRNPNSIAGNGAGVVAQNPNVAVDGTDNWWGHPSGPTHANNAGGLGDSATSNVGVQPFLTSPPPADRAPLVHLAPLADILEEGTRMIVHWEAQDDGSIVSQRIEYTPHSLNPPLATLVGSIPPGARSWEIVVPQSPPSSNNSLPVLRVVVVDDRGQEGWDEAQFFTPYEDFQLTFSVGSPPSVVRPGEQHPVCWTINSGNAYLMIDDVDWSFSLGGTTTNCLSIGLTAPGVSTDLARIAVAHTVGAGGRIRYEYSDYFAIRPDPLLGDAPPTVRILQPLAGTFPSRGTVPIRWTASDDEALRSFLIQASYDGGRSWNVVADLPGTATAYDWKLPKSQGIADLRLRVVARDLRFQASSDTTAIEVGAEERLRTTPRDPAGGLQTKP